MAQALAYEKVDEDGNLVKRFATAVGTSRKPRKAKKPRLDTSATVGLVSSDDDDIDFKCPEGSMSDSESDSNSDDMLLSNTEVFYVDNLFREYTHLLALPDCRHSPFQDDSLHRAWCFYKAQTLKVHHHR
jgi:hypothetical protein